MSSDGDKKEEKSDRNYSSVIATFLNKGRETEDRGRSLRRASRSALPKVDLNVPWT